MPNKNTGRSPPCGFLKKGTSAKEAGDGTGPRGSVMPVEVDNARAQESDLGGKSFATYLEAALHWACCPPTPDTPKWKWPRLTKADDVEAFFTEKFSRPDTFQGCVGDKAAVGDAWNLVGLPASLLDLADASCHDIFQGVPPDDAILDESQKAELRLAKLRALKKYAARHLATVRETRRREFKAVRAARVSTNNPFKNVQSLEEAERSLREVLGAEAGTALEDLSTSGKAKGTAEALELSGELLDLRKALVNLMHSLCLSTKTSDNNEDANKVVEFVHVVSDLHDEARKDVEHFRRVAAEKHRKAEDEKEAVRRRGRSRKAQSLQALMEKRADCGEMVAVTRISAVKDSGQLKPLMSTHFAGLAPGSRIPMMYRNFLSKCTKDLTEDFQKVADQSLKRACLSQAPSDQKENKRAKSSGEAEVTSDRQLGNLLGEHGEHVKNF